MASPPSALKRVLFIAGLLMFTCLVRPVSADWELQESGTTAFLNDIFFIDDNYGWAVGGQSILLTTDNGGNTWIKQQFISENNNLDIRNVLFTSRTKGFCIADSRIYTTYDGGKTWIENELISDVSGIFFLNENIGWITGRSFIKKTTDGGRSWLSMEHDGPDYTFSGISCLESNTGWMLGGYYEDNWNDTDVFQIDDNASWSKVSTIDFPPVNKIVSIYPDTLWALGQSCLQHSCDGGFSWKKVFSSDPDIETREMRDIIPIDGQNTYVLLRNVLTQTSAVGVYNQYNADISEVCSIPYPLLINFHFENDAIWCVGSSGRIVKCNIKQNTNIDKTHTTPHPIILFQNHPNPFNTATSLRFSINSPQFIELNIYDVTGRLVSNLTSGYYNAGIHAVPWNARDNNKLKVSSGIYFSVLRLKTHLTSSKMLFVQ